MFFGIIVFVNEQYLGSDEEDVVADDYISMEIKKI